MKRTPAIHLVKASYVAEQLGISEMRVYSIAADPNSELVMLPVKGKRGQRDSYVFIEESVASEKERKAAH